MSQSGAEVVTTLGISVGVHTLFMNYQSTLEPLITCPPIGIYLIACNVYMQYYNGIAVSGLIWCERMSC